MNPEGGSPSRLKLRWPEFERRIRRRVRREIAADVRLKAEYRRQRRRRLREKLPEWVSHVFLAGMFATGWFAAPLGEGGLDAGLAVLALWGLIGISLQSNRLAGTLYLSPHLAALFQMPLTDAEIFDIQGRRFIRGTASVLAMHVPAGIFLGIYVDRGLAVGATCLVFVLAHALLFTALAVHAETLWPHGWHRHFGKLWWLLLAVLFGWKPLTGTIAPWATAGYWIPGFGWLNAVLKRGLIEGDAWAWTLLFPVAIAWWTLPWSWRRLRARYQLAEPEWEGESAAEELPPGPVEGLVVTRAETSAGPTELLDAVRTGGWRQAPDWRWLGWFDRMVGNWMTPRERLVAEFMTGGLPGWTPSSRNMAMATVLALVAVAILGRFGQGPLMFGGYLLFIVTTPVLGGEWRGFALGLTGTMGTPLYALHPVGFGEVVRVMLKVNVPRCLLAAPLVVTYGGLGGWFAGAGATAGVVLALKVLGLVLALQPTVVAFRFSNGTFDTRQLRWYWLVLLLLPVLAMVGAGFGVVLAENWSQAVLSYVATVAASAGELALYARLWGRGRFDLLGTINSS